MASQPYAQELAEKIAELDRRDKAMRLLMPKAQSYSGTCQDMCPEKERYTRMSFSSGASIFESNEYTMVKEYRRAGAGQEEPLPSDLRTIGALEKTMNHLVFNIMDDPRSKDNELALAWYDFLWDRMRAIRKDITQQNMCDKLSIKLVERCTRFHVHSCYAMNRIKDFDVDMNKRNLNDCLQMLRQMYNDFKENGGTCNSELEFQKYDILLHLDEDPSSINVTMKTSDYREDMKLIIQLFVSYVNNDYYTFFKLMKKADYMESCILCLYVNKMRLVGMRIIISACPPKQVVWYPANIIIEILGFDNLDDLKEFATSLKLEVQEKDSKHYLLLERSHNPSIRDSTLVPVRSRALVEDKMFNHTVGSVICLFEVPKQEFDYDVSMTPAHQYDEVAVKQATQVETKAEPAPQSDFKFIPTPPPKFTFEQAPKIEFKSDPVPKFKFNVESASQFRFGVEPAPQAEAVVRPKLRVEALVEPESQVKFKADSVLDMKFENERIQGVEDESEQDDQVEIESKPASQIEFATEQELDLVPESESEPEPELESEFELVPELGTEVEVEPALRAEVAEMMPVGRFKRFRNKLKFSVPPKEEEILRSPPRKKIQTLGYYEDLIKDERRANTNLFQLISTLSQQEQLTRFG